MPSLDDFDERMRALLLDPPVLLLDEPTAAMDLGAEEAFKQRLAGVLAGRTLVVVTHRPALLELVDHVIVVEPARLVTADGPGLRLLYVTLTRTTKSLAVVYAQELPEGLRVPE